MNAAINRSIGSILAIVLAAVCLPVRQEATAAEPAACPKAGDSLLMERIVSPWTKTDFRQIGFTSCAATACHGGPRAGVSSKGASRGSEVPLWLESDPHARSWRTLTSPASMVMLQRLDIVRSGRIVDGQSWQNCLACHATTETISSHSSPERELTASQPVSLVASDSSYDKHTRQLNREGVGCGACHGPAQAWRNAHYADDWDRSTALQSGFAGTQDLLSRARICASCHVGDATHDMNHDMIAAGHPALWFEMATFHARLPKHWRPKPADDPADDEARLWLAGQLASLDAWLAQLESRAAQTGQSKWPELASFDCVQCHQPVRTTLTSPTGAPIAPATDLSPGSRANRNASPGAIELSTWYRFGMTKWFEARSTGNGWTDADQHLRAALVRFDKANVPLRPELTVELIQETQAARVALDHWLTSPQGRDALNNFSAPQLQAILDKMELPR